MSNYLNTNNITEWLKKLNVQECFVDVMAEFNERINNGENIICVYNFEYNRKNHCYNFRKLLITDNASILWCVHAPHDIYILQDVKTYYYNFKLPDYFEYLFHGCIMSSRIYSNNQSHIIYECDYFDTVESLKLIQYIQKLEQSIQNKITNAVTIVETKYKAEIEFLNRELMLTKIKLAQLELKLEK